MVKYPYGRYTVVITKIKLARAVRVNKRLNKYSGPAGWTKSNTQHHHSACFCGDTIQKGYRYEIR